MRHQTTRRAAIAPPLGFIVVITLGVRTFLRGVRFRDDNDLDSNCLSFVGDELAQSAMRPLADFVLGLAACALAISNVAQVAQYQGLDLMGLGKLDSRAADLVFDVLHEPV